MEGIHIITTSSLKLNSLDFDLDADTLIVVQQAIKETVVKHGKLNANQNNILESIQDPLTTDLIFLSKDDLFKKSALIDDLTWIFQNNIHHDITILLPYESPPESEPSEDGIARSFIVKKDIISQGLLSKSKGDLSRLIYNLAFNYLNSASSRNIEIFQINKPNKPATPSVANLRKLNDSLLLMPHHGSTRLLHRCVHHLKNAHSLPIELNICFDDESFKSTQTALTENFNFFLNNPINVGPYLARHYLILRSDKKFIFFQDSDDISTKSRFEKQIHELNKRKLDLLGCHELRMDQFKRKIIYIRYPLNVNKALQNNKPHSLFHPTSLISKEAYLKTGGFSTNLRLGYDTQFLIRSHFYLKIGNIDDFLYIRFRRPNSLTTNPKTKIGTDLRKFLLWRWKTDFQLILEDKLNLEESSLIPQKHTFTYQLQKIKSYSTRT